MIRARFSIISQDQKENDSYPTNTTIAEFDFPADLGTALHTFQEALSALTAGRPVIITDADPQP